MCTHAPTDTQLIHHITALLVQQQQLFFESCVQSANHQDCRIFRHRNIIVCGAFWTVRSHKTEKLTQETKKKWRGAKAVEEER